MRNSEKLRQVWLQRWTELGEAQQSKLPASQIEPLERDTVAAFKAYEQSVRQKIIKIKGAQC